MGKDLRDLIAFLSVAHERSFTRASAKLGISQSAQNALVEALKYRG
jgi:DNA-binding transcriptional LysR family regulator